MNRRGFLGVLGSGVVGAWRYAPALQRLDDVFVERWSWVMGQPVHVMLFAGSESEGLVALRLAACPQEEASVSVFLA